MAEMVKGLALVGLIRSDGSQRLAVVDYNVEIFRQGLERVYAERIGQGWQTENDVS
jgi:Ras-related GTP-binding protein C/D